MNLLWNDRGCSETFSMGKFACKAKFSPPDCGFQFPGRVRSGLAQALGLAITGEFPHFPVNPVGGLGEPDGSMSPCPDLQQVKEIMESYDPTPLIDLCEAILADGELSSDEVYRLSEFLNATPDCTLYWPGKQLATLLVEVWKDGEISPEERQQEAELLMDIHVHDNEHGYP